MPRTTRCSSPSLADRSLAAAERAAAEALVAACAECADLHADLLALAAATRAMPTPARPRDYTPDRRPMPRACGAAGWRRLVAAVRRRRGTSFSRPLAVGLTTLGLAGLLVAGPADRPVRRQRRLRHAARRPARPGSPTAARLQRRVRAPRTGVPRPVARRQRPRRRLAAPAAGPADGRVRGSGRAAPVRTRGRAVDRARRPSRAPPTRRPPAATRPAPSRRRRQRPDRWRDRRFGAVTCPRRCSLVSACSCCARAASCSPGAARARAEPRRPADPPGRRRRRPAGTLGPCPPNA